MFLTLLLIIWFWIEEHEFLTSYLELLVNMFVEHISMVIFMFEALQVHKAVKLCVDGNSFPKYSQADHYPPVSI